MYYHSVCGSFVWMKWYYMHMSIFTLLSCGLGFLHVLAYFTCINDIDIMFQHNNGLCSVMKL